MDSGAETGDDSYDIQTQVLQTTLAEVSAIRKDAIDGDTEKGSADDSSDCCVICLDAITEPCTALPCSHTHFDFLCLLSWLEQRASCPLCKNAVYKVRYNDNEKGGESIFRVPNAPRPRNNSDEGRGIGARGRGRHLNMNLDENVRLRLLRRDESRHRRHRNHQTSASGAPPSPDEIIQRRRYIYRHLLYSLHVGSNRTSQYRPAPTPAQFASTPHLVTRARLWIRRELQVFAFLSDSGPGSTNTNTSASSASGSAAAAAAASREVTRRRNNAEFLLEYIVAILKTVDIQGSGGQAEDMLSDFLGRDHARLFWHELRSWLRSPAQSLEAWDREVQYPDVHRKRRYEALEDEEEEETDRNHRYGGRRGDVNRGRHEHRRSDSRSARSRRSSRENLAGSRERQ